MARKPAGQTVSRDEILWAAAEMMRRKGYDATTMKDIGGSVNLTAASLYHHFQSKDFLLLAVLETGIELAIDRLAPVIEAEGSHSQRLDAMIRSHVSTVAENIAVGAAMVFEIRALLNADAEGAIGERFLGEFGRRRKAFIARRDYFERLFRDEIDAGIAAGEFRQVDSDIVTKTILGAHNWIGVWYREGGRLSGDQVAEVIVDLFMTGLRAQPALH